MGFKRARVKQKKKHFFWRQSVAKKIKCWAVCICVLRIWYLIWLRAFFFFFIVETTQCNKHLIAYNSLDMRGYHKRTLFLYTRNEHYKKKYAPELSTADVLVNQFNNHDDIFMNVCVCVFVCIRITNFIQQKKNANLIWKKLIFK